MGPHFLLTATLSAIAAIISAAPTTIDIVERSSHNFQRSIPDKLERQSNVQNMWHPDLPAMRDGQLPWYGL